MLHLMLPIIVSMFEKRLPILFPNLTKWLGSKRLDNKARGEVDGCLDAFDTSHYKQGIAAIAHRLENCIELKGDYAEK